MKKFFLYSGAFILVCIVLANLLPMAGLLISGVIVAAGVHFYTESTSRFGKIISVTLVLAGLLSALSNFPAFIGVIAIVALYFIFKDDDTTESVKSEDPFANFEKEWAKLQK